MQQLYAGVWPYMIWVSKLKSLVAAPIRCGYSSVSCNTHDIPKNQSPKHTVQMLHTMIPPHCITAMRWNEQKLANQTNVVVIGVRNITTMESSTAFHLFFFILFNSIYYTGWGSCFFLFNNNHCQLTGRQWFILTLMPINFILSFIIK